MKTIWIFNHYATNQFFDKAGRHYCFAKYLLRSGYKVVIFCASTVHNTDKNLIDDGRPYTEQSCDGISFVIIKARNYKGNGKTRIFNMLDYYRGLYKATRNFDKPDVIIGSSVHLLACMAAIKISKKLGCENIAEIRDLWPESIVAYGFTSKYNPVIKMLYQFEKWIYKKAGRIIFTMEGGRDYIIKKGWAKASDSVDLEKVGHINNGVDLELFDFNKEHNTIVDADLDNPDTFKVIYTGSIRRVNNIGQLLEVAQSLENAGHINVKILIYGDGDHREALQTAAVGKGLHNIVFKGKVRKSNIPAILSKGDLCLLHLQSTPISAFGMSMNKLFDYLSCGRPILSNFKPGYDLIEKHKCGISESLTSGEDYANQILRFVNMPEDEYNMYCENARRTAEEYDFKVLTRKLLDIINDRKFDDNYLSDKREQDYESVHTDLCPPEK